MSKQPRNPKKTKAANSVLAEPVIEQDEDDSISVEMNEHNEHEESDANGGHTQESEEDIFDGFDLNVVNYKFANQLVGTPVNVRDITVRPVPGEGKNRYQIYPNPSLASITSDFLTVFGTHLSFVGKDDDNAKELIDEKSNPKKRTMENAFAGPRQMARRAKELWIKYRAKSISVKTLDTIEKLYIYYIKKVLIAYTDKLLRLITIPDNVKFYKDESTIIHQATTQQVPVYQVHSSQVPSSQEANYVTITKLDDELQQLQSAFQDKFKKQQTKIRSLQDSIAILEKTLQETIARIQNPQQQPRVVHTHTPQKTVPKAKFGFDSDDEQ